MELKWRYSENAQKKNINPEKIPNRFATQMGRHDKKKVRKRWQNSSSENQYQQHNLQEVPHKTSEMGRSCVPNGGDCS